MKLRFSDIDEMDATEFSEYCGIVMHPDRSYSVSKSFRTIEEAKEWAKENGENQTWWITKSLYVSMVMSTMNITKSEGKGQTVLYPV